MERDRHGHVRGYQTTEDLNLNQWYHITTTHVSGQLPKIYINTQLVDATNRWANVIHSPLLPSVI